MTTRHADHACTPRELAILTLVVNGLTDKEIALRLGLARRTVSNRMSIILLKLSARNRTEAVAIAISTNVVRYIQAERQE